MRETKRLRLTQSSQQFNLPARKVIEDANVTFRRGSDAVGGTESGNPPLSNNLPRIARTNNYCYHKHEAGFIAHHKRNKHIDEGFELTTPALDIPASQGGHGPRGVFWITMHVEGIGVVTVAEAHWLTGARTNLRRRGEHIQMTNKLEDVVKTHAKGFRVGFFMGDVNIDDDKGAAWNEGAFTKAGLTTVFDELGKHPNTHGLSTLDIVGSYDLDRRVKAKQVVVHNKQHKDHRDVTAVYDIKVV